MLLQIGPLCFDVVPFNTHEYDRRAETDFAKKDVIGRRKIFEHVGEGDDTFTIRGKLFPYKTGGLGALALAHTIREAAMPQMMVRGDGFVFGWFLITEIAEHARHLGPDGVGQLTEVTIKVERCDSPSPAGYFEALFGLMP